MANRQRLERVLEIDRQIRSGYYPNTLCLAEDLEVSERTMYYDIAYMREQLHAPISFDDDRGGYYYVEDAWVLPSIYVTEGELMAFFFSVEIAQRYLGTAFEAILRSAASKINLSLKGQVHIDLEDLRRHYTFGMPASANVDPQLLIDMYRAIEEQLKVRMRYFTASRGEWNERTIYPYHLYNLRGDWYLVAYDRLRNQMRNFCLGRERVDWWQVLDEKFLRRPDFSPDQWMRPAFQTERGEELYQVVVRFNEYQTRWIRERKWHETQELEFLPGGGSILRFKAGGLDEVKRWVMSYGAHAEVLEPEVLRQMVMEELERAVGVYTRNKGTII